MRLLKILLPIAALSSVLFIFVDRVLAEPFNPNELYDGLIFENLFTYMPLQHNLISHILTLGYAAQLVGLVYFIATLSNIALRYRLFIACFMLSPNTWGVVPRQFIYTVADITSKVFYGAILRYIT
ncbi:hypothetical protein NDI45_29015 [Leptolyngbya sp. GB1-A1]|uniref:hypothetical protein n=1 Tax=Leptolyngbya sp. GB1-A1 TaxID=2933908 RepID=UPI003298B8C8